jgi:hypothetical protein
MSCDRETNREVEATLTTQPRLIPESQMKKFEGYAAKIFAALLVACGLRK